jgi:hypothetical protein
MIKGALYMIAVEIEDLHQDTTDHDLIRGHQEGNMRVLKGALRALDMHGKKVKIVDPACRIMRYSITAEDRKED